VLFFNGQRLTTGIDYSEIDNRHISIESYIPESDDILIFEAIVNIEEPD